MFKVLHLLSESELRNLAAALRDGLCVGPGLASHNLTQICGARTREVEHCLNVLSNQGLTNHHAAVLMNAVADGKQVYQDPSRILDLVLSGPDVPGIQPRDTAAVVHDMFTQAQKEIMVAGYAVHQGNRIFKYLAMRMGQVSDLDVTLCLDVRRGYDDQTPEKIILQRFRQEFLTRHWPWPRLPKLYYDPRSLATDMDRRSSLHAKCMVIDRRKAFITSANFTEAAQNRNIEAGLLVNHPPVGERLCLYFEKLIESGDLLQCDLQRPEA